MLREQVEFKKYILNKEELKSSPFHMFALWYNEAVEHEEVPANIMTLATSGKDNRPSARTLLLKAFNQTGFTFHTNYLSRKGQEIKINPYGTLLIFWYTLERQVRIEGIIKKSDPEESDNYFKSRPFESQLSAIASPQSRIIPDRKYLDNEIIRLKQEIAKDNIIRPDHWGGYILLPERFEFWQGRPSRLHDRFEYVKQNKSWIIHRLAP